MTTDLVTWLRQQLDEDERTAPDVHFSTPGALMCDNVAAFGRDVCTCGVPARLKRDVDAKRRVLAEHTHYPNHWKPEEIACGICHHDGHEVYHAVNNWCTTVRALALPYADRPGYRDEWRP